ncbi:MAG: hypothetical protein WAW86_03720 [Gammaproteobacteria bacterium]
MKKPPTLTKTCTSCGIEKPLSAFLLLTKQGTVYGSICASCRQAPKSKEYEDSTTSKTGLKIDTKSRIHTEIDKKEKFDQVEEEYYEERDENEEKEIDKVDAKQDRVDKEKKHRHEHLSKRSFLSTTQPNHFQQPNAPQTQQAQQIEHGVKLEQAAQEEKKLTEVDVNEMSKDTYVAGKVKNQGEAVKRLVTFLGSGSAIGRSLGQKNPQANKNEGTEPVREFPDNHWSPGSRKR